MKISLFLGVFLLSLGIGWLSGWDFTRSPIAGFWAFCTLLIAVFVIEMYGRKDE